MATVREQIIMALSSASRPLAEHEFGFCGTNSSNVMRELRFMARDGIVQGQRRIDQATGKLKRYKEWSLISGQTELKFTVSSEIIREVI